MGFEGYGCIARENIAAPPPATVHDKVHGLLGKSREEKVRAGAAGG